MSKATAGTIELTTLAEEFLDEMGIGDLSLGPKIGFCEVCVYDNEGQIPHFHIISKGMKWECCVRIYENKYFKHGSKQGTLSSKQCKTLNKWLQEKNKLFSPKSNWETICGFWIAQGNPINQCKTPETKQPDYTNITN